MHPVTIQQTVIFSMRAPVVFVLRTASMWNEEIRNPIPAPNTMMSKTSCDLRSTAVKSKI